MAFINSPRQNVRHSAVSAISDRRVRVAANLGLLLGLASAIPGVDFVRVGPFRIWHVIIILALVYVISKVGPKGLGEYRPTTLDYGTVAFVVLMSVLENLNAGELDFDANYGPTIAPAFYLIAFVAARIVLRNLSEVRAFLHRFVFFAIPSALISVLQFTSPAFGEWSVAIASGEGLERRISGDGLLRAAGLFGHWTGAGFYFCAMIAAALVALSLSRQVGKGSVIPVLALVSSSVAALTTLTYSVIATAFALLLMFALTSSRKLPAVMLIVVAVIVSIPIASEELSVRAEEQAEDGARSPLPDWVPSTLRYRFRVWTEQTIPAIDERPGMGWGSGVLTDEDPSRVIPPSLIWDSAESQWFTTALSFGIPVMLVLALIILLGLVESMRASAATYKLARPFTVLLVMAIVSSFTVPVFTNRGFPLPFWILLGVVVVMARAKPEHLWEGIEQSWERLSESQAAMRR